MKKSNQKLNTENEIYIKLEEADYEAACSEKRFSLEEILTDIKKILRKN